MPLRSGPQILKAVKVFVQRAADQFFLKTESVWVTSKDEATVFANCTPAIDFCVERGLTGVRLWLSFDDPKYDFPMEVFRAETKTLVKYNHALREKGRVLLAELDNEQERKKQFPFKRKGPAKTQPAGAEPNP